MSREQSRLSIPRMIIKQSSIVEIIAAYNPNSLYVRPLNHITDKLIYKEPYALIKIDQLTVGSYGIAPIDERTFARCLVKKILPNNCVRVFFIDHAVSTFVHTSCIFKLEAEHYYIPWQSIHISLGRVYPLNNKYSDKQIEIFQEILGEFEYFEITTCDYSNLPESPQLVTACGFNNVELMDATRVSIEELLAALMDDVVVTVMPFKVLKMRRDSEEKDDPENPIIIDSFRQAIPLDWEHKPPKATENEWNIAHVVPVSIETIDKTYRNQKTGCLVVFVDSCLNKSPSEMFVRLLHAREMDHNDEWLIRDMEELTEFEHQLDSFYQDLSNQKPLSFSEIDEYLEENGRMHAMCCVQNQSNGIWQRVEVLSMRTESALVRFLDIGGKMQVKIRQLHRIHKIHTTKPPFMHECRINSIDFECWDSEHIRMWKQLIPNDIPLELGPVVDVDEDGAIITSDLRIMGKQESIVEEFMNIYNIDDLSSSERV